MTINERIFTLMQEQGKKKSELAEHLGVGDTTVGYWSRNTERGGYPCDMLIPTAEFLGVSVHYLLTGEPDPPPTIVTVQAPDRGPTLTEEEEELLKVFRGLDREGKTMTLSTAYTHRSRLAAMQGSEAITS